MYAAQVRYVLTDEGFLKVVFFAFCVTDGGIGQ
jgi:hypothetical protein